MSEPLLQVLNKHAATCGDPLIFESNDADLSIGYFENGYGEQWLFTFHRPSQTAERRGGDIGWNTPLPVHDGNPADVNLNASEQVRLHACWLAAVDRP